MQLEQSIQHQIREQARCGASVAEVIRLVREKAGADGPGEGRLLVSAYLTRAFDIPLHRVVEISGWVGFEDGGRTTDEELQLVLGGFLRFE